MAIIGKIRKRGGLIVIIIGVALAAFVLGDFWKKGNKGSRPNLGEICGEKITYNDFETQVEAQIEMVKQQTGEENLSSDKIFEIRNEIWAKLERDNILKKEYNELGLAISADELSDMVQGKEPHQYIQENFKDPQTGVFNVSYVKSYMQQLDQLEQKTPGTKARWENFLESIESERIYTKYLNLIKKGYYVPAALAKKDYEQKNTKAVLRIIAKKYSSVADNSVTVTDDDYQKYYDKHKNEYAFEEATRDIEYITYDVEPSDSDIAEVTREINGVYEELKTQKAEDVPLLVSKYSDESYDSVYRKKGLITVPAFDSIVFKSKKGDVLGPYLEDNVFYLARVMDFQERPDSMRASHILISYAGATRAAETIKRTKDQAKKMADSLLTIIKKNPKEFDSIAKKNSDDAAASAKAGDLDWFADMDMGGNMIYSFTQACVEGKVGDTKIIETPFGYHIVKVTGKKKVSNKAKLALITSKIKPSKETYQNIYATASEFSGEYTNAEKFNKGVIDKKLNKRLAENIEAMSNTIAGLESPREIVKWAYAESTKKGDVSGVFDLQTKYVVACLKEIREKGVPTLEQIKTQIEPYVKNEKKAETLIAKIKGQITPGITLEALSYKLDSAVVDTLDMVTFSTYSLPGYGPEPEIIGNIFTIKPNTLSEPLKGKTAIYVLQVDNIIKAPEVKDYKNNILQMTANFQSRVNYDAYKALEKNAKITDNRISYY
ncbi:MAG TPA: SurA N-terminal domain-containing protein [Bacteroidales bacterium]|nr:SurA N-terminal domain-containing protein [Bacteroidales bacterium]HPS15877.1 SurA N-terminal domain-containing protein [Bacteroidales bacterium]